MDRKSIIILVISFIALMAWYPLMNKIYPPKPLAGGTNTLAGATNAFATNTSTTATAPSQFVAPAPPTLEAPTTAPKLARADAPEQLVTVENENARYTFTSHGGGLKLVELKRYPESIGCRTKEDEAKKLASLNTLAPMPIMALLGSEAVQGDGIWALTQTFNGVKAEKTLTNGLRLVKQFNLSTNYQLSATIRLENQSAQPLTLPVQEIVVGTATPMATNNNVQYMGLIWYDGKKDEHIGESWFANTTLGCNVSTPRTEYVSPDSSNIVWAAVHNQFFTIVVLAQTNAPKVVARHIPLPLPPEAVIAAKKTPAPFGYQTAFLYPELSLVPGESIERSFSIFAGPKEYNTLARLGNSQDLVMNFGGFFGWFAKGLLLSMNGLNALGLSYGLAIIAITFIIKLVFWPLTQASTRSMKRMAELQPQMKALQAKYKDDPRKMNQKLMEFMKENKVSPIGGCLPMLLQIPVFFGFYQMLQSAIELRGARFLWACDLSQPDTIFHLPGLGFPVNPLPIIMGATQFWQMHLTPPSPGVDPMQQKIIKYMPLMFLFIIYNFSAGLALYWTVQNLLTIVQMKLTKSAKAKKSEPPKPGAPPAKLNFSLKKKK